MTYKIYLAGPMAGLTYESARFGWRQRFAELVADEPSIECYSPMRGKEHLAGMVLGKEGNSDMPVMSRSRGITCRDRNDVRMASLMVACFLEDGGNYSLGTAVEFGWADGFKTPVIMVAEEGNPHRDHAILHGIAGFIVPTIEEAASITKHVLLPAI